MGELADPLKLRAHHLLCLLGFRKLGYSPEFVEVMGQVLEAFQRDTAQTLILVDECDFICAACPHNVKNECCKNEGAEARIKAKDTAILKKLGFRINSATTTKAAWNQVKRRITPADLSVLCSRCQWLELGYCVAGLTHLRTPDFPCFG